MKHLMRWGGVNEPTAATRRTAERVHRRMFNIACEWKGHGELVPAFSTWLRCVECNQTVCQHDWGPYTEWWRIDEHNENRQRICNRCTCCEVSCRSNFTLVGDVVNAQT